MEQLNKCPLEFQKKFRKIYQQLKIVDNPLEVKGVEKYFSNKKYFKINIDESKIIIKVDNDKVQIASFLYNQYFTNQL